MGIGERDGFPVWIQHEQRGLEARERKSAMGGLDKTVSRGGNMRDKKRGKGYEGRRSQPPLN